MFDCTKPVSLSEHLKAISAVRCSTDQAAAALETSLKRFGPVSHAAIASIGSMIEYLLPLKSFTTRFTILGLGEWSVILTDMAGEHCFVSALAVSRVTHRSCICVVFREQERQLHIGEDGKTVREVQSLLDVDRWYFFEAGEPFFWEDPLDLKQARKRKRLEVSRVTRYFELFTGHPIPDWRQTRFSSILGLERSTKDLQVPITLCETKRDLP